ncbi:NAD(P)-dependent oxidoreductase [Clostridium sp. SHJSY1]|uniref:NAD(P)-dependent oxidoreductase n=1 Tax=Clostridium sp. SHJSY1 TaxID=2942483 RepID=UPI0028769C61|nr:NAD(P)-dependent oxidoreductase [Clostridium sp. SHJSY1]MDS0524263.1 NAD(P)-dependent oxidoreductase [Clostridium sp. SHJSY1]
MFKDNKKNILRREVDFSMVSLFSSKLRVGVIGAGRAGYIKAKHFLEQGCYVEVLCLESYDKFQELDMYKLKLIREKYSKKFILDKHLIVIAIDGDEDINIIKSDCESLYKIYINSKSFENGMGAVPVQKNMNNFIIGINTIGGNPKASVMLGKKAKENLKEYDDFIGFITKVRSKVKKMPEIKKDIIDFIASEDFFFFFEKGKEEIVLKLFYKDIGF